MFIMISGTLPPLDHTKPAHCGQENRYTYRVEELNIICNLLVVDL